MKKLKLEIERELLILEQYKITPEEWMIIQLIFLAQEEENHPELLANYMFNGVDKTPLKELLTNLQNKQIINKSYKIPKEGQTFIADNVEFNKIFLNNILKNSGDMGYELFQEYPLSTYINGTPYSLRNISKHYKTQADFFYAYGKAIRFNPKTHERVMEILIEAKEQNLINYNICEFIISNKWDDLEALMSNGIGANNSMREA